MFSIHFQEIQNWICSHVRDSITMTLLENEQILEKDKTKHKLPFSRCNIYKRTRHLTEFCLKRIHSARRLGLVYNAELLLPQFLYDIDLSLIPTIHWNDIPCVIKVQQSVIRLKKFFSKWSLLFFQSRDYHTWRHLFDPNSLFTT